MAQRSYTKQAVLYRIKCLRHLLENTVPEAEKSGLESEISELEALYQAKLEGEGK